jgi:hypothetical protein
MGDKFLDNRDRHLVNLNKLTDSVEEVIDEDVQRLIFFGEMPGQLEKAAGHRVNWHIFKYWLFKAVFWVRDERT